jgi:hypothetical protein
MQTFNREHLINNYINESLDNMDWASLSALAADMIANNVNDLSDNELINMINEVYPHLIESESENV